jgi:hypothetical protein
VWVEDRLPQKQKAQGGKSAKGLISIRLEVIGLCRRHQHNHLVGAPAWTPILAGAKIRTVFAVQTFQSHYRLFIVRSQGRFRDDLPQLPDRCQPQWKAPGWTTTLPLSSVR